MNTLNPTDHSPEAQEMRQTFTAEHASCTPPKITETMEQVALRLIERGIFVYNESTIG